MIKSNKAACDLNRDLINDLIDGKSLLFTIKTSLET